MRTARMEKGGERNMLHEERATLDRNYGCTVLKRLGEKAPSRMLNLTNSLIVPTNDIIGTSL